MNLESLAQRVDEAAENAENIADEDGPEIEIYTVVLPTTGEPITHLICCNEHECWLTVTSTPDCAFCAVGTDSPGTHSTDLALVAAAESKGAQGEQAQVEV